jgi:hypothetical protein
MALVETSGQRSETLLKEDDLLSQIQSLLESEIEYTALINKNGRLEPILFCKNALFYWG